jgi:hypothetical protein
MDNKLLFRQQRINNVKAKLKRLTRDLELEQQHDFPGRFITYETIEKNQRKKRLLQELDELQEELKKFLKKNRQKKPD